MPVQDGTDRVRSDTIGHQEYGTTLLQYYRSCVHLFELRWRVLEGLKITRQSAEDQMWTVEEEGRVWYEE